MFSKEKFDTFCEIKQKLGKKVLIFWSSDIREAINEETIGNCNME